MRDTHHGVSRIPLTQPVSNLFRRPALSEQPQHRTAKPGEDGQFVGLPWPMRPPVTLSVSLDVSREQADLSSAAAGETSATIRNKAKLRGSIDASLA
jgi:hypothetical protein